MSLILEALRKSEAERRRGQAPQLFDVPAPVAAPPPAPARLPAWWAVPVLLALGLALLWWRSAGRDDPPEPATPTATDATQAEVGLPDPVVAENGAPAPALLPRPSLPVDAPTVAGASSMGSIVADVPPPPAADTPARPATAIATPPATPPASTARSPDPAPSPIASAAPPPSLATPPVAAPPAATTGLMRLADLSASERNALPPLRMSMHLWAAEPAGRFVILDGIRVGEGDRVGSAVVDEITPDGAVLAWQGRRLKVPVP